MTGGYAGTFGDVLRAARLAVGLSQESLARASGVSAREINYLETGRVRRPRRATVDALTAGLSPDSEVRELLSRYARPAIQPVLAGLVPSQLPPVAAHTVGLDHQLAIAERALGHGGTMAVCGMPGVGKTTFAIRLASQLRPRFPDGQLFADLRGFDEQAVSPEQALGQLIRGLLGAQVQLPPGADERSALFRSALAGRRVLLVLDNARDEAQLRPLMPGDAGCVAVVTSRNVLGGLDVRHRLHLEVLDAADATALLEVIAGQERIRAEPDHALAVVAACGGLPLAIRIVATRLATRPDLSVAELADRLADQRCRIRELAVGDIAIASAFELSYRMLADRERLLFARLGLAPAADFSTAAAAVLADLPEGDVEKLLDTLVDMNLLEADGRASRYRMHDLVRLYARNLAATGRGPASGEADGREAQQAVDRLSAWYIAKLAAAARLTTPGIVSLPADSASVLTVPAFDGPQQAAAWLEDEQAGIVAAAVRAAQLGPNPAAWLLADGLRGFFYLRRDTDLWLMAARAGLAAARRAGDRSAMAAMLGSLGMARAGRAQYGLAIRHYRQAASLATQWPIGRAAALGNLGIVYYLLGQFDDARHYYEMSLAVNREIGNRHGESVRLSNLAGVYQAAGMLDESSSYYNEGLTIYRQLGDRHGEALTSCCYAIVCREMGKPDEALSLVQHALAIAGQLRSRLAEAAAQCGLAATYLALGRHDEALRAAVLAVTCSQAIGDGVYEVDALNTLGDVERGRGDTVSAAVRHADAHAKARGVGYRIGEIEALIGLARTVQAGGRPRQAAAYAQQAAELAVASGHRLTERQARACLRDLGRSEPAEPASGQPKVTLSE